MYFVSLSFGLFRKKKIISEIILAVILVVKRHIQYNNILVKTETSSQDLRLVRKSTSEPISPLVFRSFQGV